MDITFTNNPPVHEWMSEKEKEFREKAQVIFSEIISRHTDLFGDAVSITFFQEGTSSVVGKVESEKGSYTIKTTTKRTRPLIEARVLDLWRDTGIQTPEIYTSEQLSDYSYLIMEYIGKDTIERYAQENNSQKIEEKGKEAGEILRKIHNTSIEGLGKLTISNGKLEGLAASASDYLTQYSSEVEQQSSLLTPYLTEKDLDVHEEAVKKLAKSGIYSSPTICHFDINPGHFFLTSPLTIFDPDPFAASYIEEIAFIMNPEPDLDNPPHHPKKLFKQALVQKYLQQQPKKFDKELLKSALILLATHKALSLLKNKDKSREKRAQHMLNVVYAPDLLEKHIESYLRM